MEVKKGDYVFLTCSTGTFLKQVQEVTKVGNIRVSGMLFNPNGEKRGKSWWETCNICSATDTDVQVYKARMMEKKIRRTICLFASTTTDIKLLEKIYKMIGGQDGR